MSDGAEPQEAVARPFDLWLQKQSTVTRWSVMTLVYTILFFAVVGALMAKMGVNFVLSPSYARMVWPMFAILGFILGLPLSYRLIKAPGHLASGFKLLLAVVFTPLLLSAFLHFAATRGFPGLLAVLIQNETAFIFTVDYSSTSSTRRCNNPVHVEEPGIGKLCNVPEAVWSQLKPDQEVSVQGYGTSWGIFYKRITPL